MYLYCMWFINISIAHCAALLTSFRACSILEKRGMVAVIRDYSERWFYLTWKSRLCCWKSMLEDNQFSTLLCKGIGKEIQCLYIYIWNNFFEWSPKKLTLARILIKICLSIICIFVTEEHWHQQVSMRLSTLSLQRNMKKSTICVRVLNNVQSKDYSNRHGNIILKVSAPLLINILT